MPNPVRRSIVSWLLVVSACALRGALPAQQLADNNRGFPPNSTFATSGIDHVNLFSHNVVVTLPIGPTYPIGAGLSHQIRLTYNSQLWNPSAACNDPITGAEISGVYVVGSPLVGAGWRLDFGWIGGGIIPEYTSPEGARHQFLQNLGSEYRTTDGSFLRLRNLTFSAGRITSGILDFPDGTIGVFNQRVPSTGPSQHGSTPKDFTDLESPAERVYLYQLQNRFADYLQVDYETTGDTSRIHSVKHYGQGQLLRHIDFYYVQKTVDTHLVGGPIDTWTVLDHVDFQAALGLNQPATQTVVFSYNSSGFQRTGADTTPIQCTNGGASRPMVAAPLLQAVQIATGYTYAFKYLQAGAPAGAAAGAIKEIALPTGGLIRYQWAGEGPGAPIPPNSTLGNVCMPLDPPSCHVNFMRTNLAHLAERRELPDGPAGVANLWRYSTNLIEVQTPPAFGDQTTEVIGPDLYRTKYHFYYNPDITAVNPSNGMQLSTEYTDQIGPGGVVLRRLRSCYDDDSGHSNLCNLDATFFVLGANARESSSETTVFGSSSSQTKHVQRSAWNGFGQFGQQVYYDWDNTTIRRTAMTRWTPNSSNWLLNLYDRQTETEGPSSIRRYSYFDSATGYLQAAATWDGRLFPTCNYPQTTTPADGLIQYQVTLVVGSYPDPESIGNPCAGFGSVSSWPTIGSSQDLFAKHLGYLNGVLTNSWFLNSPTQTVPPWFTLNQSRDPVSGLLTTSYDVAGASTTYQYDILGRPTQVTAQDEAPTTVTYGTAVQAGASVTTTVTVSRNGGAGLLTSQQYVYDGFGRLTREIRQMPAGSASAYSLRLRRYDSVGREYFVSEWVGCLDAANCATQAVSATAGTTSSNFDPFGRAQAVSKADGSTMTISYADGPITFSDTQKTVTVNNVNGTCPNSSCGGSSAATVYRYDVLGRLILVTEPAVAPETVGAQTAYTYDANGKLTCVKQGGSMAMSSCFDNPGGQFRSFVYDAAGNLRSETTPEKGTVSYADSGPFLGYGSLGNLLREVDSDGLVRMHCYDFAGRLNAVRTNEDTSTPQCGPNPIAAGRLYVQNFYDSPTAGLSLGKLTQRIGYNPVSPGQPTVTESFTYSGLGGRLSQKNVVISGTPLPLGPVTQAWTYNSLGLLASYSPPKRSGDSDVTATLSYSNGTVAGLIAGAQPLVSNAAYHFYGGLAAWTAGNGLTTTIGQDPFLLPRPASITSGSFSTGSYTYDGAGNIKSMGSDIFGYDTLSRLSSSSVSGRSLSYSYDHFGNLNPATVDPLTNRLLAGTYDPRGNLTALSSQRYDYDALSRQTAINGGFERYLYDGAGERIARLTSPTPGAGFYTITPCRLLDTRLSPGTPVDPSSPLTVQVGGNCGVAPDATGMVGNLAVVPGAGGGYFKLVPKGTNPLFSTLTFKPNVIRSNNVDVGLSGNGQLTLSSSYPAHGILDTTGYYRFPNPTWTLTFRDEASRLSTEYTVTSSAITRTKNYFYLGNLLVATGDQAGAFQYYASDHLGTPRRITNQLAAQTELHAYQPYGQEITTTFGSQPLKFASMERDAVSGNDYDHARFIGTLQGRFLSPDTRAGRIVAPQTWNRYTYARNNPLKFVDPDGNVVVGFTGWFNSPTSPVFDIAGSFATRLGRPGFGPGQVFHYNEGGPAQAKAFLLNQLKRDSSQPVILLGHSAGARAAINLAWQLKELGIPVTLLLTFDPVMGDPKLKQTVPSNVERAANFYQTDDDGIIDSLAGGTYLSAENPMDTSLDNHLLPGHHKDIPGLVARDRNTLDEFIAWVRKRQQQKEQGQKACPDRNCND